MGADVTDIEIARARRASLSGGQADSGGSVEHRHIRNEHETYEQFGEYGLDGKPCITWCGQDASGEAFFLNEAYAFVSIRSQTGIAVCSSCLLNLQSLIDAELKGSEKLNSGRALILIADLVFRQLPPPQTPEDFVVMAERLATALELLGCAVEKRGVVERNDIGQISISDWNFRWVEKLS